MWAVPLTGDKKPLPILQSQYQEQSPQISANGKWIAASFDEILTRSALPASKSADYAIKRLDTEMPGPSSGDAGDDAHVQVEYDLGMPTEIINKKLFNVDEYHRMLETASSPKKTADSN